jgi:uracil-DNA glycosylase family 4
VTEVDLASTRRHPLAECERCPLNFPEFAYVPSFGPAKADIAIIGQNPGAGEIRTGKPFMGPSGQLLDNVLRYYNLDRSKMLISNACSCTHRTEPTFKPPPAAVNACRPRLMSELRDREVKQVMLLGNVPASGILGGRETITKLRVGTWREASDLPGVQIFCTFHPAYCLRTSAAFPSMATDFGKLVNPPPPWREPKFTVWEDALTAIKGIKEMKRRGIRVITLDIETSVPADKDVSFDHPRRYKILCIGMAYTADKAVVIGKTACQSVAVLEVLRQYLDWVERIITQNGKFDKQGTYAKNCDFTFTDDTMIQSYAMDERTGIHGLKIQLEEKLGYPRYAENIKQYVGTGKNKSFANIPLDVLYRYNAFDTCGTFALCEHNEKLLADDDWADPIRGRHDGQRWGLVRLHQFMVETTNNLAFTELNGFPIDMVYNKQLVDEYALELDRLEQEMFSAIGGVEFNPRSPQQLKKIFHELDVSLPMVRRPNGTMSETTDANTLKELYEKYKTVKQSADWITDVVADVDTRSVETKFLEALLAYRKAAKTNGTYIKGIRKLVWRGRVYPTVLVHTTVSGRTSQRRPSLQVIPHAEEIKRQFTVADYQEWRYKSSYKDPGDWLLLTEFDYKQIELRVLCWLAQEPYLRDIFADPSRDLFGELANIVKPERSSRTTMHPKDRRNIVKAFVYGLAYGREYQSIADEFAIPVHEAMRMQREFFEVIPNVVAFREKVKRDAVAQNDLVTPFGRRRRFWLVTRENRKEIQNEACSFYPQSIASDICIQAFNVLRPRLKGKARCRNLVHDALFWECKEADLAYVAHTVTSAMQQSAYDVMGDYVRVDIDAEVGRTWGDMIHLDQWMRGKRPYEIAKRDQWKPA